MQHHLILRVITKFLVGTIIMFAFYVQFHGDFSPGGGFQAGVIMAVAFILYGLVFGLKNVQQVFPPWIVHKLIALGVLLYAGVGVLNMLLGYEFLHYGSLDPHHMSHGQHTGIIWIEAGVGITVTGVMIAIYYAFAGRTPRLGDDDW